MSRHAAVEVDTGAVTANVRALARLAPHSELCAVVKADGYGHGAVQVARAAIAGGATRLGVALVDEGRTLRDAGIQVPILVLSEPPADAMPGAFEAGLTPVVYSAEGIDAAADAAAAAASAPAVAEGRWEVHLKVDTGMHRVGVDPADAVDAARRIVGHPTLALGGTATHLAVADEPTRPETSQQLRRFTDVVERIRGAGIDPGTLHAANSAGLMGHPDCHLDMVRVGIAIYGIAPCAELHDAATLRPAMSVRASVSYLRRVAAGEGISYGLRHVFAHDALVAVVPVGYADGVPRRLGSAGGEVLIGGARRPIRGVVTMDQLLVEVTDGPPVVTGDEVVLIGRQGDEEITAREWADRLDTIPYEVVCGFGPRLPRIYPGAGSGCAVGPVEPAAAMRR